MYIGRDIGGHCDVLSILLLRRKDRLLSAISECVIGLWYRYAVYLLIVNNMLLSRYSLLCVLRSVQIIVVIVSQE